MSSIVRMGTTLYLKAAENLQRDQMDRLADILVEFQKSGDESFVMDLTNLKTISVKACTMLLEIQAEARKKGRVYVLTPRGEVLDQLLAMHIIRPAEIYENRTMIKEAMKDKVKGNIPQL